MQCTIQSYKSLIEQMQSGDTQNLSKYKEEIEAMQK